MVELSKKGNTKVLKRNGITEVWLYNTPVVIFDANSITLNYGRMNQASDEYDLGYQVYQDSYYWYVNFKGNAYKFETGSLTLNRA